MGRLVCFVGPTISRADLAERYPAWEIRPPIAHGDLIALQLKAGDVAAIIDGVFFQAAPVRHKEILWTLEQGITVIGAASMGALRAAELHRFGMLGYGRCFRLFASGLIDGDDEVALVHTDADNGYAPLTIPLVNVRYTCRHARRCGLLSRVGADLLVRSAAALCFNERTYPRIVQRALENGLSEHVGARFLRGLAECAVDVKRKDALGMLTSLSMQTQHHPKHPVAQNTVHLHFLKQRTQGSTRRNGQMVTDDAALTAAQLYAIDFPALFRQVALEGLAQMLADRLGLVPGRIENELDRLCDEIGVSRASELEAWCRSRSLGAVELTDYVTMRAKARAAAHVVAPLKPMDQPVLEQVAARFLFEVGALETTGMPSALEDRWLTERERLTLSNTKKAALLAVRTFRIHPGIVPRRPLISALKLAGGFAHACDAVAWVRLFNAAHADSRYPAPSIAPEGLASWFHSRWGATSDLRLALLDRGFERPNNFFAAAEEFYEFDRQCQDYRHMKCILADAT